MVAVNLFLVGAAKAGTSSLWASLRAHPDIFGTYDEIDKEPSFFSPISRHLGLDWYCSLYAAGVGKAYRLDASTAYLTSTDSAAEIHAYNSDARILIVLRDPAARAYSLYNWMVADGYEWAPSFERALELEDLRFATPDDRRSMPQYFWNYMYRRSGLYFDQVARYVDLFGDQVLILDFADLVRDPNGVHDRILDFLGLPRRALPVERENPSRRVISPRLSFAARRIEQRLTPRLPERFRSRKAWRDMLVELCQTNRSPPPMSAGVRETLDRAFAPELERIHSRWGLDLRPAATSCSKEPKP